MEKHGTKRWVEPGGEKGNEVREKTHYLPDIFKVSFITSFMVCRVPYARLRIFKQDDVRTESLF